MKTILSLFFTFSKIGLFTFGGGYAMISVIEDICVAKKKWITHEDMMNVTVIAESTPGPIAINCATFVGYRQAGFWGAAAATLGVVLPSFVIVYGISTFLDNFLEITIIANAFRGIKLAVGLLILNAALNMGKKMPKTRFSRCILICSAVIILLNNCFSWKMSSILLMALAGAASAAVEVISRKAGRI